MDENAHTKYRKLLDFCKDLSLCPRGHSVYHDHTTWRVFCFAVSAHAALFRQQFPSFPACEGYDQLLDAIDAALVA